MEFFPQENWGWKQLFGHKSDFSMDGGFGTGWLENLTNELSAHFLEILLKLNCGDNGGRHKDLNSFGFGQGDFFFNLLSWQWISSYSFSQQIVKELQFAPKNWKLMFQIFCQLGYGMENRGKCQRFPANHFLSGKCLVVIYIKRLWWVSFISLGWILARKHWWCGWGIKTSNAVARQRHGSSLLP